MPNYAYVRSLYMSAYICPYGRAELPRELSQFGKFRRRNVRVRTPGGEMMPVLVACDWLRDAGWIVYPAGMFTAAKIRYINATDLQARGWTPRLINRFLGFPDTTVPMELYALARVKLIAVEPALRHGRR